MILVARIVGLIAQAYVWIIILSVILSYFIDPYHPVRKGVDDLVRPLLDPIRRFVPLVGMIDFSPIVLIFLVQFLSRLIVNLLIAIS